ncbi:polyribonucleotide nucleotidyltransferase 1, mitochondrial-like isoform X2 [Ostrea edulis]|uniref:polyribonucleotide nucleotidyltransferase 1, mitochondrial-like isoform X2 n=1 Tax=Ostrea edulis TaxID=37623 RepID=UPI0024AF8755|nr:polyribonucleotide nucleotidyltransferase 1, mitochondrial-like isoform X2 [Ostrea edulis]
MWKLIYFHSNKWMKFTRWDPIKRFQSTASISVKLGNRDLTIETGKLAKFADGAAVIKQGETSVLVTAVSKALPQPSPFLPLTVDYRLKAAAAGRIPMNYFRRERGPTENEILTSRVIDRSLRPLIPEECQKEIQHRLQQLCRLSHGKVLWVGAVRVGYVDKSFVINPLRHELERSDINLMITSSKQGIVMLEGGANNVDYELFKEAIKIGHAESFRIINSIQNLATEVKTFKHQSQPPASQDNFRELRDTVYRLCNTKLRAIFTNYSHDKFSRDSAVKNAVAGVMKELKDLYPSLSDDQLNWYIQKCIKHVFRDNIFKTEKRCDGRDLSDLRNISCSVDILKPLHGSSLFQRGQTQVLCTMAYDSLDMSLKFDPVAQLISGAKEKNFMLHYEFPPYATNEIGRPGATLARREIGHGALAERGLSPIVPDNLPFTLRLTSEVLESNGSSSMASVCGGSLALMDAGVPIKEAAAGVAIGLVTQLNYEGKITKHRVLTDLLGIEDYFGDMDFKIAGTRNGVTALQADIKLESLPIEIVFEAIKAGKSGISRILDIMDTVISKPRKPKSNAPVKEKFVVNPQKRSRVVGIGGQRLRQLAQKTGVQMSAVDESTFDLFAPDKTAMLEAKELLESWLEEKPAPRLDFGAIYTVRILEVNVQGVMVEVHPSIEPVFIHRSQLDLRKVHDATVLGLTPGDEIQVKYFGSDPVSGQIRLSRRILLSPALPLFKS